VAPELIEMVSEPFFNLRLEVAKPEIEPLKVYAFVEQVT
jgi:hypothetical protein